MPGSMSETNNCSRLSIGQATRTSQNGEQDQEMSSYQPSPLAGSDPRLRYFLSGSVAEGKLVPALPTVLLANAPVHRSSACVPASWRSPPPDPTGVVLWQQRGTTHRGPALPVVSAQALVHGTRSCNSEALTLVQCGTTLRAVFFRYAERRATM